MNNQFKLQINSIFKSRTNEKHEIRIFHLSNSFIYFFFFFQFPRKHVPIHSKNSNYFTNFPIIRVSLTIQKNSSIHKTSKNLLHSPVPFPETHLKIREYQYPSSLILPFPKTRPGPRSREQLPFLPTEDHLPRSSRNTGFSTNSNTVYN